MLIHGRDLLGGCTRESVAFTTFRGRVSQRWHKAFYQAEAFLINLRDSHFRPVALPGLPDYPKAEFEKSLVATMGEVATASQAVVKAEAEVTAARFRLKDEQDETARAHRWTLQLVEALGFLVDAPELVDRLPPSFRGNRRPSASARGGDRAKRWLLASSRGVDHRSGGLKPPENGGFLALRPWRDKILGIFGR